MHMNAVVLLAVCCLSVWDKREFQTALISAFIDLHYCVLDFFESFLYQDKKDSPRGGERNIEKICVPTLERGSEEKPPK